MIRIAIINPSYITVSVNKNLTFLSFTKLSFLITLEENKKKSNSYLGGTSTKELVTGLDSASIVELFFISKPITCLSFADRLVVLEALLAGKRVANSKIN